MLILFTSIWLHRLMLTCATHHSTNHCCCSSQTWKPSKLLSASPAWSSRPWQKSAECSVSLSVPEDLIHHCVYDFRLANLFPLTIFASFADIRRSEELSLLKPPDDSSKKKKKKDKNSPQGDIWDIWDSLSGGPGGTGTATCIAKLNYNNHFT